MELPANSRGYIEKDYLEIYFFEDFSCHFPSQNIYTKKLFYNIYDFGKNVGILNRFFCIYIFSIKTPYFYLQKWNFCSDFSLYIFSRTRETQNRQKMARNLPKTTKKPLTLAFTRIKGFTYIIRKRMASLLNDVLS